MITVSIITPIYNSSSFVGETFKSVLNQTFQDWEWIIVDDCSTDNSFGIVSDYAKQDSRIKVFRLEKNSGTAVARNTGLKHASGRYITFLDSDDLLDPDYLEKQLNFIKDNGPLISAGYRRKTDKTCTDFYVPDVVDYKLDLKGNPISCLSTMYDRSVIGDVYFPEDIEKPEDYVFWLNILKRGFVCKGNHEILATYIIHSGSKSSNKFKLIKCMHRVYHKTQGINWFKSWYYVLRWALYGKKKYKNVR